MYIEDKLDWYDQLKEDIFKYWSVEQPQIPITKTQWENMPKPTYIEIGEWFI